MSDLETSHGRYDTIIALAVLLLFGIFVLGYIGIDDTDEFVEEDADRTERAALFEAFESDDDDFDLSEERADGAALDEAYQRGVSDTEARYEYELLQLEKQLRAYERAILESEGVYMR